ncbi:MAG: SpoIID/LytB domain-containing protein [Candidatus Acidiferrales bacterium]
MKIARAFAAQSGKHRVPHAPHLRVGILAAWSIIHALLPSAARAQDVRVGLFTLHPPAAATIRAVSGELHWRTCASCKEKSGASVSVRASGERLTIVEGDGAAELRLTGNYRIEAGELPAINLHFPLRVESREDRLSFSVTMPQEEYVAEVLAAEASDSWKDEALKAMAVAVRTYATRLRGAHEKDGFDFCDTTHCQVVRWNSKNPRARAAVEATSGEILQFEGAPARTYYHQNCGGMVAASNEIWPDIFATYLRGHTDPYCVVSGDLKWESVIALADVDAALRAAALAPPRGWTEIEIAGRSASGRAQKLRLAGGAANDFLISASTFRYAVSRSLGWNKIRSDLFEVRTEGDRAVFFGRGAGHGVGMCQTGAEEMAVEGKDYRQILDFYYPGTQLAKQGATAQWQKRSSEHFELETTAPEQDESVLPVAEKLLAEEEKNTGWDVSFRVQLKVFATMDAYRDQTGQPGWVAASARGRVIRLQPLATLKSKGVLESTLRHELLHLLVEERARAGTPVWFREGLVLYLSNASARESADGSMTLQQMEAILEKSQKRDEVEKAYAAARARIASLVREHGKETVLGWLSRGIPRSIINGDGDGDRPVQASHD